MKKSQTTVESGEVNIDLCASTGRDKLQFWPGPPGTWKSMGVGRDQPERMAVIHLQVLA